MLEQATDEHVARYKAARFAAQRAGSSSTSALADLCCGIGGDLLALAGQGSVVAVDRNSTATHFAAANMRVVCARPDVSFHNADAGQFAVEDVAAWHIDPDRRVGGRRSTSLDSCAPSGAVIEGLLARGPHAAIKLAPATQVPQSWEDRCELEWISRGGECRQLVAWHGNLAQAPGQRRATIVDSACGVATPRTVVGFPNRPLPITARLENYIFDVDPAVLAAHLKGTLAAECNLSALGQGSTYLTGSAPLRDAALDCFQVNEVLPLRIGSLAKHFRERKIGRLEIKKRGVDVDPDRLRRELKLRGNNSATLLITSIAGRPAAILAHRLL
jgi:hypothetical protein